MNEQPNVVIVMARCSRSRRDFGIRFEEKARGQWMADWAFAIKEKAAKKEGYDHSAITGAFGFDIGYPGCLYCYARSVFKCTCGKVACWDGETRIALCPWCGSAIKLNSLVDSLQAGGDR